VGREGNGIERLGASVSEAETGGKTVGSVRGEIFVRGGPADAGAGAGAR
jgi:hypothetical protein